MFARRFSVAALSVVASASLTIGCSAATHEEAHGVAEDDVVGIADLAALEQELGLKPDKKDVRGNWQRPEEKLTAGKCYKEKIAGGDDQWTFRRYVNGAVFLQKRSVAGTWRRPIACVDLDVSGKLAVYNSYVEQSVSIEGYALDVVLRYGFGKAKVDDKSGDSIALSFEHGAVLMGGGLCYYTASDLPYGSGIYPKTVHPALSAAYESYASCKTAGRSDEKCVKEASRACGAAMAEDVARETIDRPAYDGVYLLELYIARLSDPDRRPSPELTTLVYQYAWSKALDADVYRLKDDPVGKFVGAEFGKGADGSEHLRYERLDAHRSTTPIDSDTMKEQLFLTPKLSDQTLEASAIVTCSRRIQRRYPNAAKTAFKCTGL